MGLMFFNSQPALACIHSCEEPSIGACESQAPTAPTSSLTQSGALATDAQGQVTSLTAAGAGDIQQAKGGKGGGNQGTVTYEFKVVRDGDNFCSSVGQDASAWHSPEPTLPREIKLSDKISTGAFWRGVDQADKLTVWPDGAGEALQGGSVGLQVDSGIITSVQLRGCIPQAGFDCGRIKPNYTTGSLSPAEDQVGRSLLDKPLMVTVHVHRSGVEVFSQQGRKFYGKSCVGDVVLTRQ